MRAGSMMRENNMMISSCTSIVIFYLFILFSEEKIMNLISAGEQENLMINDCIYII